MSAELERKDGVFDSGSGRSENRSLDCEAVFTALDDPDCRAVLEATADQALTASELTEQCDIPRSTTYRKLEQLTEAGLLEERIRLSTDGKHAREYHRTFEDVTVSLCDSEGIHVGLSESSVPPEAADRQ
jgi:DNA-binding transcriptional ArsR family regulator